MQRYAARLGVLSEIAVEIQGAYEIEELTELARTRLKWLLDFEAGSLVLQIPPDGLGHFALVSTGDARELAEEALTAGHPVRRRTPESDAIGLPIAHGALAFARSQPLSSEDLLVVRLMVAFFGSAIERALNLREVRRLAQQLEAASQQREHLLRMVIHDLRNPLTGLQGALSLLETYAQAGQPHLEMLSLAHAGANNLEALVESLLGVVEYESGSFEPRLAEVAVASLLAGVVRRHRPQASLRQVELRVDLAPAPVTWVLDADWIGRTLENLLLNAIRYSPEGTAVQISAAAKLEDGARWLRIAVADEGPGVPEPDRERIFEAGVRLADEGRPTRRRGIGLGLAFCRLAVESHGGWIGIVEGPTSGACLAFDLPEDPSSISSACNPRRGG